MIEDLAKVKLEWIKNAQINRIDFGIFDDKVNVWFFDQNWKPSNKYPSNGATLKPAEFDVDAFINLLKENGWTVLQWSKYGARAFLGNPWPIRSADEIRQTRQRLEREEQRGVKHSYDVSSIDLAFEL